MNNPIIELDVEGVHVIINLNKDKFMESLPTVDINRDGEKVTINESDLQDSDVLWEEAPPSRRKPRTRKVTK